MQVLNLVRESERKEERDTKPQNYASLRQKTENAYAGTWVQRRARAGALIFLVASQQSAEGEETIRHNGLEWRRASLNRKRSFKIRDMLRAYLSAESNRVVV